jgi:hypothetical protein
MMFLRGRLINEGKILMNNFMQNIGCRLSIGRRWIGVVLLLGLLMGCGEDPRQLFETAQFEEQQNNRAHARELYEQIIQDHPDSEYADKARQRLEDWKLENQNGNRN